MHIISRERSLFLLLFFRLLPELSLSLKPYLLPLFHVLLSQFNIIDVLQNEGLSLSLRSLFHGFHLILKLLSLLCVRLKAFHFLIDLSKVCIGMPKS